MVERMRDIYLLRHGIYGESKRITKDEFWKLSEAERELVDPQIEDEIYTIKQPKEVTTEEMNEIINMQISNDISKIKKYLSEIKFIITFSFVSSVIIIALILLFYMF